MRKLESPTSEGNTIALLVSDKAGLVGRVRELEILLEETEKEGLSATRGLEGRIGTSEMELARLNQANLSLRDEVNAAKQLQTNLVSTFIIIASLAALTNRRRNENPNSLSER